MRFKENAQENYFAKHEIKLNIFEAFKSLLFYTHTSKQFSRLCVEQCLCDRVKNNVYISDLVS